MEGSYTATADPSAVHDTRHFSFRTGPNLCGVRWSPCGVANQPELDESPNRNGTGLWSVGL